MTDEFTPGAIYKRLLSYALEHRKVFALGVVGMVAFAGANIAIPWLLKPLMDEGFVNRDPDYIRGIPLALLAIFLWRGVAGYVAGYSMQWVGRNVVKRLRGEVFERCLYLPTAYFERNTSGNLIAKLTYHVEQVAGSVTNAFINLIKDGLTVLGLTGYMFYLNVQLALLSVVGGPIIAGLLILVSKRFRRYSSRIQGSVGDVTHIAEEAISAHRVIKVFGGQHYETEHFDEVNEHNRKLHNRMARTKQLSTPVVEFIAAVALAAVIYIAASAQGSNAFTPGTFVSFFAALMGLMGPLRRLSSVNVQIQRSIAAASSIFELLEEPQEPQGGEHRPDTVQGAIRYENVSFRYPSGDKLVLQDIDLDIKPNQMVAFVGRSGSGKSTLLSLLPRFYDTTGGRILIDGHDLREYNLRNLRSHIALVDQNVVLFNDTVARNIAYGALQSTTREQIIEAAKAAHAWEFIQELPEGLDTQVGQHGVLLSGGQRQRLAIARALLKDAPVLILDEATSALDTESERKIQKALEVLMQGRTTLVIAHRLSTVQDADMIVVMDEGRILERGTHEELLNKGDVYASLYKIQLDAGKQE